MENKPIQNALPPATEKVKLESTFRAKYRGFAAFLICCALLLAAFAVSAVWMRGGFLRRDDQSTPSAETNQGTGDAKLETELGTPANGKVPPTRPEPIPAGAVAICKKDLSYLSLGASYLHNETPYTPDVAALLELALPKLTAGSGEPLVLILHTHTSESYLDAGTAYIEGADGDATYSEDPNRGVLSVGAELAKTLNEKGISAIHCTVMHDSPTLAAPTKEARKQ